MKGTIQDKVHHTLDDLRALRDEIRLNLHLAGMDAKDAWRKKSLRGFAKAFRDRRHG